MWGGKAGDGLNSSISSGIALNVQSQESGGNFYYSKSEYLGQVGVRKTEREVSDNSIFKSGYIGYLYTGSICKHL